MSGYDKNLGWNAGARSITSEPGDLTSTFQPSENCIGIIIGLGSSDTGPSVTDIEHGFYFRKESGVQVYSIYERNVAKTAPTAYVAADVFHVTRADTTVKYWLNSTVVYTSLVPSSGTVFLDTTLYSAGDSVI